MMISRGDIYMARLNENDGSIQGGVRPILVISNNKCNEHSPVITIVPLTSKLRKSPLPTHVLIEGCGTSRKSIILVEQIMSLNKINLGRKIGSIKETIYEQQLERALRVQLNM